MATIVTTIMTLTMIATPGRPRAQERPVDGVTDAPDDRTDPTSPTGRAGRTGTDAVESEPWIVEDEGGDARPQQRRRSTDGSDDADSGGSARARRLAAVDTDQPDDTIPVVVVVPSGDPAAAASLAARPLVAICKALEPDHVDGCRMRRALPQPVEMHVRRNDGSLVAALYYRKTDFMRTFGLPRPRGGRDASFTFVACAGDDVIEAKERISDSQVEIARRDGCTDIRARPGEGPSERQERLVAAIVGAERRQSPETPETASPPEDTAALSKGAIGDGERFTPRSMDRDDVPEP